MSKLTITSTTPLPNGVEIPLFGLGTYLSKGDDCYHSVLYGLKHGYIHLDTAQYYKNEDQVGKAIKDSGVDRSKIFITTKLFPENFGEKEALPALYKSLKDLQVDYVDLVLLHAPAIPSGISKVEQNGELNKAQRESAWKALEKFYELGLTKSIGVSNFWPRHFEHLETFAKVKPMINQIEYHPWNQRPLQVEYCQKNGIVVEGWGPLAQNKLLEDETMKKLAEKYKKTVAQVSIRWHLQKGIIVIPKSIKESRVIENADVYDFEVSEEDIKLIDSLHKGYLCVGVWEHDDVL